MKDRIEIVIETDHESENAADPSSLIGKIDEKEKKWREKLADQLSDKMDDDDIVDFGGAKCLKTKFGQKTHVYE